MSMLHLIVCSRCQRQLDAGDRAAGELVPCPCGAMVAVPPLAAHESAVLRCSACGAPREGDEPECRYCGSSFSLHERAIDTICPVCMAWVSSGARFCDHCGSPILADQAATASSPLRCPACEPRQPLRSRQFAGEPVAVSDCETCGGLWADRRVFEVLLVRARHGQLAGAAAAIPGERPERPAGPAGTAAAGGGRLYRPCPVCGSLMNRQNYGRKSGVILDLCGAHGIWFDLDELPRVLAWVQGGGEERAGELEAEEAHAEAQAKRRDEEFKSALAGGSWGYAEPNRNLLGGLVDLLGHGWSNFFDR